MDDVIQSIINYVNIYFTELYKIPDNKKLYISFMYVMHNDDKGTLYPTGLN